MHGREEGGTKATMELLVPVKKKATGSCLSDPVPSMEEGALGVPRTHMFFSGEA